MEAWTAVSPSSWKPAAFDLLVNLYLALVVGSDSGYLPERRHRTVSTIFQSSADFYPVQLDKCPVSLAKPRNPNGKKISPLNILDMFKCGD